MFRTDIDINNQIRHRFGSNDSTLWSNGTIGTAELVAYDGDLVGLQACWSGLNSSVPIRLFYASNSKIFKEYLWRAHDDKWMWQRSWSNYSGAAGVGC